MAIGRATGKAGALKTLALWLGLVALTIQALVPLCAPGAVAIAGGNTVTICTSHGVETITLGTDGKPVKAPATQHHSSDCMLCSSCPMGSGFIAPTIIAFATPSIRADVAPVMLAAPAHSRPFHFSYVGRAPPRIAKA